MKEGQGFKYYIDFAKEGGAGIVHTQPTRIVPELALTKAPRNALDEKVRNHARELSSLMSDLAHLSGNARQSEPFIRKRFLELQCPDPGFSLIAPNIYLGWFYVVKDNQIYTTGRDATKNIPRLLDHELTPYFKMKGEEAAYWQRKVSQPLNTTALEELKQKVFRPELSISIEPGIAALREFVKESQALLDAFWEKATIILDKGDSVALMSLLKSHLLDSRATAVFSESRYRQISSEIKKMMKTSGITMYPVDQNMAIILFSTDDGLRTATAPIPHQKQHFFQRYLILGQKPFTRAEIATRYKALVNPNDNRFQKLS